MKPLEPGSLILVRYRDTVLFRDSDASQYQPWIREAVAWLDFENQEYLRLVWERLCEPNPPDNARTRSTGLTIPRKTILELKRLV